MRDNDHNWNRNGHCKPARNNHRQAQWAHEVRDEAFKGFAWLVLVPVSAVFLAVAVVVFFK